MIDLVASAALVGVVGGGVVTVTTGLATGASASAYPTPVSSPLVADPAPPTELVSADPYVGPGSEKGAERRTTTASAARAAASGATRLAAPSQGEFAPHAGLGGPAATSPTGSVTAMSRATAPAQRNSSPASIQGSSGGSTGGTGGAATKATTEITVSSFNVLGGSHTKSRRGKKRHFASGPVRAGYAAQLVEERGVDLVGFQELEGEQARVVVERLPGYSMFPGPQKRRHASSNSIMWRDDTWRAVETHTVGIPYFHGKTTQMPYVRLRNLATGTDVWVANFHNPASTRKRGNQTRWRAAATDREIVLANRLRAETGLPVIFTGDMNEREVYFCRLVGATELRSSAGGGVFNGRCSVPRNTRIDWIFGTPELDWLSHELDKSALVRRTTDHPMVLARATLRISTGS